MAPPSKGKGKAPAHPPAKSNRVDKGKAPANKPLTKPNRVDKGKAPAASKASGAPSKAAAKQAIAEVEERPSTPPQPKWLENTCRCPPRVCSQLCRRSLELEGRPILSCDEEPGPTPHETDLHFYSREAEYEEYGLPYHHQEQVYRAEVNNITPITLADPPPDIFPTDWPLPVPAGKSLFLPVVKTNKKPSNPHQLKPNSRTGSGMFSQGKGGLKNAVGLGKLTSAIAKGKRGSIESLDQDKSHAQTLENKIKAALPAKQSKSHNTTAAGLKKSNPAAQRNHKSSRVAASNTKSSTSSRSSSISSRQPKVSPNMMNKLAHWAQRAKESIHRKAKHAVRQIRGR